MASILVVDDDSSVLRWMSRAIEGEGHRVSAAACVDEALNLAKKIEFQLAVLDFRLPDGNGCELFRELRLRSPQIAGLLVTAFATTSLSFDSGKLGFAGILEKPLKLGTLIDATKDALLTIRRAATKPSIKLPSLERLAKAIVTVSEDESDFRQLKEWGRRIGMSRGAVRELCYAAGVKPHDALAFARSLRVLRLSQRLGLPAQDLLDFSERRSLTQFLARAHIGSPTSLEVFCETQELFSNPTLINRIRALLGRAEP